MQQVCENNIFFLNCFKNIIGEYVKDREILEIKQNLNIFLNLKKLSLRKIKLDKLTD